MQRSLTLARALGVASAGLGIAQVAVPEPFARLIGVKDDDTTRDVIRYACGGRELGAAAGILAIERTKPLTTVCARVAGDVVDAGLLVAALKKKPKEPQRIAIALGAVAGIAALDVLTAVLLVKESASPARHAITVRGPRAEIERRWNEFNASTDAAWYHESTVYFKDAPGDRGTEIHLVTRVRPAQDAKDALRRFKQVVETGEVVRSDATPEGQQVKRMFKQRPAQPLEQPVEV